MASETEENSNVPVPKKTLRIDRIFKERDHQWHFVKTTDVARKDRFSKYTLVVRRTINYRDGLPRDTEVEIRSSVLVGIFRDILQGTRCEGLHLTPPTFTPEVIFHVMPSLLDLQAQEEAKEEPNHCMIEDIKEVHAFVSTHFDSKMLEIESFHRNGEITYDHLWSLFPPGCEIIQESGLLKEPQILKFSNGFYVNLTYHDKMFYLVDAMIINNDGEDLGWGEVQLEIPAFSGTRAITSLPVLPLKFHPDKLNIRNTLSERGKMYLQLSGPVCKEYDGMGVEMQFEANRWVEKKFYTSGRIMIDPATFKMQLPNSQLIHPYVTEVLRPEEIPESDLIFCNHRVLGFSFAVKMWGAFAIPKLREVVWDMTAINKLIIDTKRRDYIAALVTGHTSNGTGFDDIIRGKGQGLVGLLSGAPGTGKTLTAEVVAELTKRPLYVVTASELGIDVESLDISLTDIMSTAHRWGCVLLIDEAETYLRKRTDGLLQQNSLVTVFLRRLEYFRGIAILTTNRRQDIDDAFRSRIHFRFHYPPLKEGDRLAIWQNFLPQFSNDDLKGFARFEMNGREIKNTIACATTICRAQERPLTIDVIRDSLENFSSSWEESEDVVSA